MQIELCSQHWFTSKNKRNNKCDWSIWYNRHHFILYVLLFLVQYLFFFCTSDTIVYFMCVIYSVCWNIVHRKLYTIEIELTTRTHIVIHTHFQWLIYLWTATYRMLQKISVHSYNNVHKHIHTERVKRANTQTDMAHGWWWCGLYVAYVCV